MNYKPCPYCGLNYIPEDAEICPVCKNKLEGRRSIFDDDDAERILCPYCEKNFMGIDDIMCKKCERKRNRNISDDDI